MTSTKASETPLRIIGYVRVSTDEQKRSGAGLQAQRRAIESAARERGWNLVTIEADEGVSAKSMRNRPGLARALDALRTGQADGLCVAKLDRLSRSVRDFCQVLDDSQRQKWALACLDIGLDTGTPTGRFTAQIIAAVAELERELIGQRTREGLAAKRAEGVVLGRRPDITPDVIERARGMRDAGETFAAIAATFNTEGIPTPRGGKEWHPSTIQRALKRAEKS